MKFYSNCSLSNTSLANDTACNEDLFNCSASNRSSQNWTRCQDPQQGEILLQTTSFHAMIHIFQTLVVLAMIAGNSLLLAAVRRLQDHRISIHYWISHLAVSDIILAVAAAIRTLLSMLSLHSHLSCKLIMWFIVTTFCVSMTGVLSMSVISWRTMQHQHLSSNQSLRSCRYKHLVAIALIWIGWSVVSSKTIFGSGQPAAMDKEGCYAFSSFSSSRSLAMYGTVTVIHIVGISAFQYGILYQLKRAQMIISTTLQSSLPNRIQVGLRMSELESRNSLPIDLANDINQNNVPNIGTNSRRKDLAPFTTQPVEESVMTSNRRMDTRHNGKHGICELPDLQQPGCSHHTGDTGATLDSPETLRSIREHSLQNSREAILHPMHMTVESDDPSSIEEIKTNDKGKSQNSGEVQSDIPSRASAVGGDDSLRIHVPAHQKEKARRPQDIKTKEHTHPIYAGRNIHLIRSVVMVIALFVVCYLPSAIYMVIYGFYCNDDQSVCKMSFRVSCNT